MGKLILLLVALVVGLSMYRREQRKSFAMRAQFERAIASSLDPCAGKSFCLVVYVAPWCPACHGVEPRLHEFVDKQAAEGGRYGLKVFVGQGRTPQENEAMAAKFGGSGVVDADGSIQAKLGVNKYPYFFVMDGEGSVILRDAEAYAWMHEKL